MREEAVMQVHRRTGSASRRAGDTLVEVLFAITVLSLVVVTALAIMNQGTSAAVRSMQITLVRQEVDSQAEALRFLNSAYTAAYKPGFTPTGPAATYKAIIDDITSAKETTLPKFGVTDSGACPSIPNGAFFIGTNTATAAYVKKASIVTATTFAQVVYSPSVQSQGIWIKGLRSTPANGSSYTDFHIRACWDTPGSNLPATIGTIVRLYEPAK